MEDCPMKSLIVSSLFLASAGSGDGFIHQLITFLLIALCAGVVYGIGWYFFKDPPFPPLVLKIWGGIFVLVGGLALVNFLLSLSGNGFMHW
jgi:hypothetical protein